MIWKPKNKRKWKAWYAWYPVELEDGRYAFLHWIERRRKYSTGPGYIYRPIPTVHVSKQENNHE